MRRFESLPWHEKRQGGRRKEHGSVEVCTKVFFSLRWGGRVRYFFLTFFAAFSFCLLLDTAVCYTHLGEENVLTMNAGKTESVKRKASAHVSRSSNPEKAPTKSVFTTASPFLFLFLLERHLEKKTHSSSFERISISLPRILPVQRTAVIPSRRCARNQFAAAPIDPYSFLK